MPGLEVKRAFTCKPHVTRQPCNNLTTVQSSPKQFKTVKISLHNPNSPHSPRSLWSAHHPVSSDTSTHLKTPRVKPATLTLTLTLTLNTKPDPQNTTFHVQQSTQHPHLTPQCSSPVDSTTLHSSALPASFPVQCHRCAAISGLEVSRAFTRSPCDP